MLMEDVVKKRLEICKACPLYKEDSRYGAICDNSKYISADGKDWSHFPKPGYRRGCACAIKMRIKNLSNHCIINKW